MTGSAESTDLGCGAECASYLPGHRLHWTQWKHAAAAPHHAVVGVHWHEDGSFELLTHDGSIHWTHHDPAALKHAVEFALEPIEAAIQWRAIRIDGTWFNCAPAEVRLTLCVV